MRKYLFLIYGLTAVQGGIARPKSSEEGSEEKLCGSFETAPQWERRALNSLLFDPQLSQDEARLKKQAFLQLFPKREREDGPLRVDEFRKVKEEVIRRQRKALLIVCDQLPEEQRAGCSLRVGDVTSGGATTSLGASPNDIGASDDDDAETKALRSEFEGASPIELQSAVERLLKIFQLEWEVLGRRTNSIISWCCSLIRTPTENLVKELSKLEEEKERFKAGEAVLIVWRAVEFAHRRIENPSKPFSIAYLYQNLPEFDQETGLQTARRLGPRPANRKVRAAAGRQRQHMKRLRRGRNSK